MSTVSYPGPETQNCLFILPYLPICPFLSLISQRTHREEREWPTNPGALSQREGILSCRVISARWATSFLHSWAGFFLPDKCSNVYRINGRLDETCWWMSNNNLLTSWMPDTLLQALYAMWSEVKVAQSCPNLCDPMDCNVLGFSILHHLLVFAQTHVHWVGNDIQPSRPLLSLSPPAFNLSQHQGHF